MAKDGKTEELARRVKELEESKERLEARDKQYNAMMQQLKEITRHITQLEEKLNTILVKNDKLEKQLSEERIEKSTLFCQLHAVEAAYEKVKGKPKLAEPKPTAGSNDLSLKIMTSLKTQQAARMKSAPKESTDVDLGDFHPPS